MCFHTQQSKTALELEKRFKATLKTPQLFSAQIFNGFDFPSTPIITNTHSDWIQHFRWGLLPSWASDVSLRQHTLNARWETLSEKPSFKNVTHQRCLILADAFFEWQWLDPKGKSKLKYQIELPDQEAFGFAGLWSEWIHPTNRELLQTYTIITTEANSLMSTIHNSKKRMPLIIAPSYEKEWLHNNQLNLANDRLIAHPLQEKPTVWSLFP